MKYYIIAGEASGDLHASNLMKELKKQDTQAEFRCWGGALMQEQGATLVKHYRDLAFMGFLEVITNLRTILRNISFCKQDILQYKPDALILVDYPGFNMRIAEFAKQQRIRVIYYISPQIWAWKQNRVHKIKRDVDKMLVILPFEKEFYARFNFDVDFVGHPLLDAINSNSYEKAVNTQKPLIALLPGSRKQEISTMLPVMLELRPQYPDFDFVVAGAPSQTEIFYKEIIGNNDVPIVFGKTYNLLSQAHAALVTSGTATLETALFEVPEVVCYSGNKISYYIARQLIKVKYISLVNLIADKELVKELIQQNFNTKTLKAELDKLLYDTNKREALIKEYKALKQQLGNAGASKRAATIITKYINE